MITSTVNLIRLDPSEGMHLRNILTGEVYESYIYLAKSLSIDDFEEITAEEYEKLQKKGTMMNYERINYNSKKRKT